MSKPFWLAAFTGTVLTGVLISRWAQNTTDAGIITTTLIGALFALATIDIYFGGPQPPTPRHP